MLNASQIFAGCTLNPLKQQGEWAFYWQELLSPEDIQNRLASRIAMSGLLCGSFFHACKLWVNGELLAEVGMVGKDKSSVVPQLATRLVFFQPENDTVELVIQVTNFHHKRGGITKEIELGGSDVLTFRTNLTIASEVFIT